MSLNSVPIVKGKDPLGALQFVINKTPQNLTGNRGPTQASRVINFNTAKPPTTGDANSLESPHREFETEPEHIRSATAFQNIFINNNNNNTASIVNTPQTLLAKQRIIGSEEQPMNRTPIAPNYQNKPINNSSSIKDPKEIEADKERFLQELRKAGVDRDFIVKGEELKAITETSLRFGQYQVDGVLILTNYKLIFNPADEDRLLRFVDRREYQVIPLGMIHKIERTIEKKGIQYQYIDIICKDCRTYRFKYNAEHQNQSFDMQIKIHSYAFPEDPRRTFAYTGGCYDRELEEKFGGWKIYDLKTEFERQGLFIGPPSELAEFEYEPNCAFKYMDNKGGVVCWTYPEWLVVPKKLTHEELMRCSRFRSKERMPALTFAFKRRQNSPSFTTLWRCAQCKPGLNQNRSAEDELMLKIIGSLDRGVNAPVKNVKIYDARPYLNAVGQQITGNGYELKQFYRNCDIEFLDIHNIHKVRESYRKMCQATYATSADYLKEVEKSEWFLHISSILNGTRQVVDSLLSDTNVVIHCSDGWDRTAQLCCLAQICIDPFFRTIIGFQTLIEKDWVSFGHMFAQRSGHASKNSADEQRAPIFIQFLDAVYQLTEQYPLSFEFSAKYLADIATHLYTCRFGTFLFNSHQEKVQNRVSELTVSLWSYLESQRQVYLNPFYASIEETNLTLIHADPHARRLTVWKEHFMYYQPGFIDPYRIYSECTFTEDNKDVLKRLSQMRYDQFKEENKLLQRKIADLESRLAQEMSKKESMISSFSEKSISYEENAGLSVLSNQQPSSVKEDESYQEVTVVEVDNSDALGEQTEDTIMKQSQNNHITEQTHQKEGELSMDHDESAEETQLLFNDSTRNHCDDQANIQKEHSYQADGNEDEEEEEEKLVEQQQTSIDGQEEGIATNEVQPQEQSMED